KYYRRIPKLFKNEFDKQKLRIENNQLNVFDYKNSFISDSLFYDGDHLNLDGAYKFTKIIRKRLGRKF
ncbi:hypothetical protein N9E12_03455, partial [Candidatus Marinimicrobia bacterium]|nr:hypothetical protein [Candidatus Neomarinimicrobiota bacterium]